MAETSEPTSVLDIAERDMCTGCGLCAFLVPDALEMKMNVKGQYTPTLKRDADLKEDPSLLELCPVSGMGTDETDVATALWPELPHDEMIGRYGKTLATHLTDTPDRLASGSGGLITWLAKDLLRRGEVDCIVHVRATEAGTQPLFKYAVSRTQEEVQAGAKSRYYPIELSGVLNELKTSGERAAIIAVPCFIKAMRGLIEQAEFEKTQIPYLIGLVCGHLKSSYFAEYLAWQMGIEPGHLADCNFRHKLLDRKASSYGFTARSVNDPPDAQAHVSPMVALNGRNWGEGQMRLVGCEFCDDVLAECADIAVGDAWLPEFVSDPLGENVVVIRDPRIDSFVAEGCERGEIVASALSPADVIQSQSSGLRHRREGLAHRLARRSESGAWVPKKRVKPQLAPTNQRQEIYDLRLKIAQTSNMAFADARHAGSIDVYDKKMSNYLTRLKRLNTVPLHQKIWRKLRQKLRTVLRARGL